jgi:dTDP-4-dehydrorhamnose reductase
MIYLLGGSGYVGQAFQSYLLENNVPYRNLRRSDVNYYDSKQLSLALLADKPEFLINAAGYTGKPNVDACEQHKADCLEGNTILPARIAEACAIAGIPWGHVSSGCIFTGSRNDGSGFTELDPPNFTFRQDNCSFYSGTKALGEEVLELMPDVYVWRLRIPFDYRENPRNYLTKVMRYQRLLDATNSISQLHEFVAACYSCWKMRVPYGFYNITNPGFVSTRQVVDHIVSNGVCLKEYKYFQDECEFMSLAAKAPRSNCLLSSQKILSVGIHLTEVNEAIQKDLRRWEWSKK